MFARNLSCTLPPSLNDACRLPEVCAQLGLPADQIMSEKGPHLLLCAALLAAPSAASWAFHKAAAAVTNPLMDGQAARTGVPAGAEAGGSTLARAGSVLAAHSLDEMSLDGVGVAGEPQDRAEGVSLLKISYSVLPLVWAGGCPCNEPHSRSLEQHSS